MNVKILLLCQIFALALPALAAEPRHEGVASCAASTCHGATQAFSGRGIRQDEYFLWQRQDRHARAYNTLKTERSRNIASRLAWGEATAAPGCLTCHADAVPTAQRGEKFLLSDGVGCESCHGGAQNWLAPHTRGYASEAARDKAGLYPLWNPAARAELCLSCHQGDAQRPMTHAIMAAGHPPLLFELDTFTQLQPAHFDVDADYIQRKGAPDGAQTWQAGQLHAAELLLDALGKPSPGLFPDLMSFDCNACHRPMQAGRGNAARSGGQAPGSVPLADAPLLMLQHWADSGAPPALAQSWRSGWRGLHEAAAQGDAALLRQRAQAQHKLLDSQLHPASHSKSSTAELQALLRQLSSEALNPFDSHFNHAEQTAMACAVLITSLRERGVLQLNEQERAALDRLYASVKDRDQYSPAAYRAALNQLRSALR